MYIMCLSKGLGAIKKWIDEFKPKDPIAFIPNAGDTYADPYFIEDSRKRIGLLGLSIKSIDLRMIHSEESFEQSLNGCSGIFVAGGNSFNILNELYRSGAFNTLKEKVQNGMAYFGESAGAVILYDSIEPVGMIDDPNDVPDLKTAASLGIVDFITLPHINREKYADLFNSFYSQFSDKHRIIKIRDDQAILTRDGKTVEILVSEIAEI